MTTADDFNYDDDPWDMPTPCPGCDRIVELNDMVEVEAGGDLFCPSCAERVDR